ncbi:MAG: RNA polymerase sigma factor SigJ, partial [Pseudomonadota bacterium]|nr:RNA polymerase sigma factor SigJ [Pseudomonadota bacterium]
EAFFRASKTGDTATLTRLLADGVQMVSDGGGKATAALNPIFGQAKVLRLLEGLARKGGAQLPQLWRFCHLNGLPAVVSREEGGIVQAAALDITEGRITRIYVVRNPDKTRHLAHLLV